MSIELLDYSNNLPTFQAFCYNNDDNKKLKRQIPHTSQKVSAREEKPKIRT